MSVDLTTLSSVKQLMQMTDTELDPLISALITPISENINSHCERQFTPQETAAAHDFEYAGSGILDLAPYDLRSTSPTIQVDTAPGEGSTTITTDQYRLKPYPPSCALQAPPGVFTRIALFVPGGTGKWRDRRITVTGDWGFPSVPATVEKTAALETMIWVRREAGAFTTVYDYNTNRVEKPASLSPVSVGMLYKFKRLNVTD